jgi:Protein of unknown function (DUF3618)
MGEQTSTSPEAIEADIASTRAHLASTVDELAVRAHPKEILRRQVASTKARLIEVTHTPEGDMRVECLGAVIAVVAAITGLAAALHIRHHGRPHDRHHGRRG